mmetsp:Transcript_2729/g.5098  ORF Transcript_2729/g.5098 Transcript_2729/m.5098 type:complete len:219 (+) Transcript_2729:441-1097(+)
MFGFSTFFIADFNFDSSSSIFRLARLLATISSSFANCRLNVFLASALFSLTFCRRAEIALFRSCSVFFGFFRTSTTSDSNSSSDHPLSVNRFVPELCTRLSTAISFDRYASLSLILWSCFAAMLVSSSWASGSGLYDIPECGSSTAALLPGIFLLRDRTGSFRSIGLGVVAHTSKLAVGLLSFSTFASCLCLRIFGFPACFCSSRTVSPCALCLARIS